MTNNCNLNSLSASCVLFNTEEEVIRTTLISLAAAVNQAKVQNVLEYFELHLINNNPCNEHFFLKFVDQCSELFEKVIPHTGHGNIGYGCANNLAIQQTEAKYHLILNPDVELDLSSITAGISYFQTHPDVGLVAPHAKNKQGTTEYLAKRTPSLLVIILRGLNNIFLNKLFEGILNKYTYRDLIPADTPVEIELASGCFMLCRTEPLKRCGGFSSRFFLYFEDFDLSKRISIRTKVVYVPSMKIVHLGGNTAKKEKKHLLYFFCSAVIFFLKLKLKKYSNQVDLRSGKQ